MKGYKVTDSSRSRMFGVACDALDTLKRKGCARLGLNYKETYLALDDGTILDDEDYFRCIPSQTIVIFYRTSETVVTGADYILDMLRRINSGYLTAGERAGAFVAQKAQDLIRVIQTGKSDASARTTRDDDPNWFADLDTSAATKEDYMFRKSQDRIRGYLYKFVSDARKSEAFAAEPESRLELKKCEEYFRQRLHRDQYFGCFLDRRCARGRDEADAPRSKRRRTNQVGEDAEDAAPGLPEYESVSYCDGNGRFACQGRWDEETCGFEMGHAINPYLDRESRILFSTWNFDHRIEKSRTIMPTLLDAIRNRRNGDTINREYFYRLLFTSANLKLVHVVCHDKAAHGIPCDPKQLYATRLPS